MNGSNPPFQPFFGGGGRAPGHLRDLLETRIASVPADGEIEWVTYYFRDRRLARALIEAAERGVKVTVTIDRHPRIPDANDHVIRMFNRCKSPNLSFRALHHPYLSFRLHAKIYCFSHPEPIALIGSFNPSGDIPEERPEIIKEIGDHLIGFNLLVGLSRAELYQGLKDYARWLNTRSNLWIPHLSIRQNRSIGSDDLRISFLPRLLPHPLFSLLGHLDAQAEIKIAASHLKGWAVDKLLKLAAKGCKIEIVAERTERRVPKASEELLSEAGIKIFRAGQGWAMPMHDKFTLIEWRGQRYSFFGSFNWTTGSMWRNIEIVAMSTNPGLYEALAKRWNELTRNEKGQLLHNTSS